MESIATTPGAPTRSKSPRLRSGGLAVVAALAIAAGLLTGCDSTPVLLEGSVTYVSGSAATRTITDPTQQFANGVTVTLYANDTEAQVASVTTNLAGHYRLHASSVSDGIYRLRIGDQWYGGTSWADADPVELSASDSTTIDHQVTWAGSISGTLVDSGLTGVAATPVVAFAADGSVVGTTMTAVDGSFTLGAAIDGAYTVAFPSAAGMVNVGGATATTFTIAPQTNALDAGQIDVTTGLAPVQPPTTSVTVTGASAATGLNLTISGSNFTDLPSASTGGPASGVYYAVRDPQTMPNEAINADSGLPLASNWIMPRSITDGNWSVDVTIPASTLVDGTDYEVITWVAHGNITDETLLSTTPITLTAQQHDAIFG